MVVTSAYLVPLPPAIWLALPGHSLLAEIDRTVGSGIPWRSLTVRPSDTWNAFYSLASPLATTLLIGPMSERERRALLPAIVLLGLISAVLGVLQLFGPPSNPLYFYAVTNNGLPVGLFANRNHFALFLACTVPCLTVYLQKSLPRIRPAGLRAAFILSATVILLLLLIFAGSRTGVALGLIGAAFTPYFVRDEQGRPFKCISIATGVCILAALATAVLFKAYMTISLATAHPSDELRLQLWEPTFRMAMTYLPFGAGPGTFERAFQIQEPDSLLTPYYHNHAHNDVLELLFTLGIPGLALAATGAAAVAWRSIHIWRDNSPNKSSSQIAKLATILAIMMMMASLVDYPLRTPAFMTFAVVVAFWLRDGVRDGTKRSNHLEASRGHGEWHAMSVTRS